jgi:hypothetical protein
MSSVQDAIIEAITGNDPIHTSFVESDRILLKCRVALAKLDKDKFSDAISYVEDAMKAMEEASMAYDLAKT